VKSWALGLVAGLAVAALAATGCDGLPDDECTAASDKLDGCGIQAGTPAHCDNARDTCEANCINAHTCAEISAALAGTVNAYSACDDACN